MLLSFYVLRGATVLVHELAAAKLSVVSDLFARSGLFSVAYTTDRGGHRDSEAYSKGELLIRLTLGEMLIRVRVFTRLTHKLITVRRRGCE